MKKALLFAGLLVAGPALAGQEELFQLVPKLVNMVGQQAQPTTDYPVAEDHTIIKSQKSGGYTPSGRNDLERLFAKVDRCKAEAFYERRSNKAPTVPAFLKNLSPHLDSGQAIYSGRWDFHGLKVSEIRLFVIPDSPTAKYGMTFDADQATAHETLGKAYKKKWEASASWSDGFGGKVTRTLQAQGGKAVLTCTVPPAGD